MQRAFDFGAAADIAYVRGRLVSAFGRPRAMPAADPVSQLVGSLISGRTRDEVSLRAFRRLVRAYPQWTWLAAAAPASVEAVIADVTFPEAKARHLVRTLRIIGAAHPDFRLDFLAGWPVERALAWLERLPGVGRKVSAATLNFSTLRSPAFVVDTHVLRVLRRFGFVGARADPRRASDAVMAATEAWGAGELDELHLPLKRLGRAVCRADLPRCRQCPIAPRCRTAARSSPPAKT